MSDASRNQRGARTRDGSRRRSALDRLDTVAPDRPLVGAPAVDGIESAEPDSAGPVLVGAVASAGATAAEVTPAEVGSGDSRSADAPAGWGIGGMPVWLAAGSQAYGSGSGPDGFSVDDLDGAGQSADSDDESDGPRRRVAIAPPAALAIIGVGVIACVVAAFGLFSGDDAAPVVDFPNPGGSAVVSGAVSPSVVAPLVPSAQPPAAAPAVVVVSVVGLVHKPGLVTLKSNARVADAIAAAGGARQGADTVSLNLAQPLHDGDQVLVGYAGPDGQRSMRSAVLSGASGASPTAGGALTSAAGPASSGGPGRGASGGLVNLNTATEEQLDTLPGVGPVTAKAIVDWRTKNGSFGSVDQLAEVDGIGPARMAKLRDLVTV